MRLRIATFNIENLVSRNRVGPSIRPDTAPALSLFDFADPTARERAQASVAVTLEDDKRQLTALAMAETQADIIALQEVDNLGVLAPFVANYLHPITDLRYGPMRLVEGNDKRGIDVAFMCRRGLVENEKRDITVQSYAEATFGELGVMSPALEAFGIGPDDRVFNRDCLEVRLDFGDRDLTLYVTHLKSMDGGSGREDRTAPIREAEVRAIRRIVQNRFGDGWREANWIVAGDLNDTRERLLPGGVMEPVAGSAIEPLFEDFAVDPMAGLDPLARWTYFYREASDTGEVTEAHVRLDYLLLSPALAAANPYPPISIVRRGLPYRVPLDPAAPDRSLGYLSTRADRYPRTGWDRPNASDHCPAVIEIELPPRG